MVDHDTIASIREASDIVSIIEEYFPLKRAGANYKALCPFHQEKTASFVVSPEKQIFHCFSCGESGDIFTFVMKMDRMEFPETLKRLADRAGIKIEFKRDNNRDKQRDRKEEIIKVNERATAFYSKILTSKTGSSALEYLSQRGVDAGMIERFQLGYAPGGNMLIKMALNAKVNEDILIRSGLAGRDSAGRLYDMFRGRIIFPIHDETGKIRGFGGRVLDDSKSPKYLNTAQTAVFEKSCLLYGFYQGKEKVKAAKRLLLLEGYMDVIAAHQYDIENAVATLGTSLTSQHIYKLKHWVEEIVFTFDADDAGRKATERGLEAVLMSEMRAKVCELPKGSDPEDIIRKDRDDFLKKVETSSPIIEWRIDCSMDKYQHIDDKIERNVKIVKDLSPLISIVRDRENIGYVKSNEIMKLIAGKLKIQQKDILKEISNKTRSFSESAAVETPKGLRDVPAGKHERILKEIMHVLLKYPQFIEDISDLPLDKTAKGKYYDLFLGYTQIYKGDIHRMLQEIEDDAGSIFTGLALTPLSSTMKPQEYLEDLKKTYIELLIDKKIQSLSDQIKSLQHQDKTVPRELIEKQKRLLKALYSGNSDIKIGGDLV
ncbi:MAG: DNA primase [Elusimicrobiota bacterium]